jgi:proteasome assembly chaperone (PAC2) family protein
MNKTHLRVLFHPKLKDPTLIVGLPGVGNVGKLVVGLLVEFTHAKLFAELYSPSFPDYVLMDKKGVCRPPRYVFYASTGRNLIILTGDSQPPLEDILAHYEVCGDVLDFTSKLGCKSIITIGGVSSPHPTKEIYVAATSSKQTEEYVEKGAVIYRDGRILGAPGLLLGLARKLGLRGACLLGSTLGSAADRKATFRVYRLLRKVLGIDIQEGL